jgi:D-aspartate ligase
MKHVPRSLPPALLTDCTWHGTLAAARDLGSRGVPVTLACDTAFAPARWSRFVTRTTRCPPASSGERFSEWLHDFARREPGHVYQPSSDDAAWVAAVHRDSLAPDLLLDVPTVEALSAVLDKHTLCTRAREAGLEVPLTWSPGDEGEVEKLSRSLPYPVVIKPRMHVFVSGSASTAWAREPAELLPAWRIIQESHRTSAMVRDRVPQVELPIIQAAVDMQERIYTVDGFIDPTGEHFAAMACVKLLQCPRGTGPGLLFEHAPLEPSVVKGLRSLLGSAGFRGAFDAEFLVDGPRRLLIDLNPRLYNHIAFEVDRGMPLPWIGYLAAAGAGEEARREIDAAARRDPEERIYASRLRARLMLLFQALSGGMDSTERRRWREWLARHAEITTDPVSAPGDRLPLLGEMLHQLVRAATHPRSFYRSHARGWPVKDQPPPLQRPAALRGR